MSTQDNRLIIFLTGLSGAGRSTGLKILEDIGFEVFDNIPLSLVGSLIETEESSASIAIGIDTRTRYFSPDQLMAEMERIKDENYNAKLIFLNCEDSIIQRRFSETRRPHPMAKDRTVLDGISLENNILNPLKAYADYLIDTSEFSVHDLRDDLQHKFLGNHKKEMLITVKSFGFKRGLPRDVDMVFDVRFLNNPHWQKELRDLTGQDSKVGAYIEKDEDFSAFWSKVTEMMDLLIPRGQKEGKSYFTIGFGCMGGQHRSVYCAEKLTQYLQDHGHKINLQHRDMPR